MTTAKASTAHRSKSSPQIKKTVKISNSKLNGIKVDRPTKYDVQSWDDIDFSFGSVRKMTSSGPEAQQHVRQQVRMRARRHKRVGNGIATQCPFHQTDAADGISFTLNINVIPHHDNKNRFIPTGFYRCWSCGQAGPWNTLAERVGMEPLEETDNYDMTENASKPNYEVEYEPPNPELLAPLDSDWDWEHKDVTVPNKTLLRVGARFHDLARRSDNDIVIERRLWLPCYVGGELYGHVDAAYNGEEPKYLNAPGPWAHSCFLFWDEALRLSRRWCKRNNTKKFVVVCEGPASALALLRWGIPAVACLGVKNWTEAKAVQLASSFDVVFACGDGDLPGYEFNDSVKNDLRGITKTKKLKLRKGLDPAMFTKADKAWLLNVIADYAAVDSPEPERKPKTKKKKKNK